MNLTTGGLAFIFLALVGALSTGCADSCQELEDKYNECCGKAPPGFSCSLSISDDAPSDFCDDELDRFECQF
jgi:hypothetical protein